VDVDAQLLLAATTRLEHCFTRSVGVYAWCFGSVHALFCIMLGRGFVSNGRRERV
jgi:hypothetical protein